MLSDDVFEARIACAGATRSSCANSSSLSSMRSGTASITRSAPRAASSSELTARSRFRASSASPSLTRPVATPFSRMALTWLVAFSNWSRLES